jgi:hypothetical protein
MNTLWPAAWRTTSIRGALVLAAFSLQGCQTTGPSSQAVGSPAVAAEATRKVDRLDRVAALPVGFENSVETTLVSGDPARDVRWEPSDREASYVRLLKLPPWTAPYSINTLSYVEGGIEAPAIFFPRLVFLDAQFKVTRESKATDFVYRLGGRYGALAATHFVNEVDRQEAYVAIVAEPSSSRFELTSNLQSQMSIPVVVPVGPVMLVWNISRGGAEAPTSMKALESGTLLLQLKKYELKKFGQ